MAKLETKMDIRKIELMGTSENSLAGKSCWRRLAYFLQMVDKSIC